ncbi:MAG TPA: DUF2752 domain-containing protein [Pirellulales bacterium]|nr:DUF2752 domain-containing protein [Pirellulales bacterium]
MTQIEKHGFERLSLRLRLFLAAASVCWLAPLATAACLQPNPEGMGTHQQLGLPPCTFVWLFRTRCPSCGMTTSWAHAVRGQWLSAGRSNAGGAVLAAIAMLAGPWLLVSAVRGRWLFVEPNDRVLAGLAVVVAAITLADWAFRLWRG